MRFSFGFFFFGLFFSFSAISNPLVMGYEASMSSYLVSAGLSQNEANTKSKEISRFTFGRSNGSSGVTSCRVGRLTSSCSVGDFFVANTSNGSLSFKDKEGNTGVLHIADMIGKYPAEDILRELYKDEETYGKLIFHEKRLFEDEIDKLQEYMQTYHKYDYAVAPLWYASTGMFIYRTKRPINKDGDYIYADSLEVLYLAYYTHNDFEDLKEKVVELKVYDDFSIDIHREEYLLYGEHSNTSLSDGIDQPDEILSTFPLNTYLNHRVFDIDKETIASWHEVARDNGGTREAYEEAFGGADSQLFTSESRYKRVLNIVRNRADVVKPSDTALNKEPEIVHYVHNSNNISSDFSESYEVSNDDLADVYNNLAENYFETHGREIKSSSGGSIHISEDSKITSKDILSGFKSINLPSIKLANFQEKKSVIDSYKEIHADDVEEHNKPSPPVDVVDNTSGIGNDVNIGGNGEVNSGSDSISSSNSDIRDRTTENVGSAAGSRVIDKPTEKVEEEEEEKVEEFKDPILPDVTGFEILEPLLRLKDSLIAKLNFSIGSGSCPTYNVDFMGNNLILDAHCQVIESVSGEIAVLMLLIYNIFALRVILSS